MLNALNGFLDLQRVPLGVNVEFTNGELILDEVEFMAGQEWCSVLLRVMHELGFHLLTEHAGGASVLQQTLAAEVEDEKCSSVLARKDAGADDPLDAGAKIKTTELRVVEVDVERANESLKRGRLVRFVRVFEVKVFVKPLQGELVLGKAYNGSYRKMGLLDRGVLSAGDAIRDMPDTQR